LDWTKIEIKTTNKGSDAITGLLMEAGIHSVEIVDHSEMMAFLSASSSQWDYIDDCLLPQAGHEISDASIIFYLGTDCESIDSINAIKKKLDALKSKENNGDYGSLSITQEIVNDQDWLHEWKKHFTPIRIGRILIVPEWDALSHEGDIVFRIDPGSAFGTGQHATTALCIESLQEHMSLGDAVLDIGCGSGILSIISLLLGAKQVTGCDIDPVAIEVTKKNANLNNIDEESMGLYIGDIITNHELQNKINVGYDIIVANIVADVIIKLATLVPALLKSKGIFIASGIIEERLDEVLSALSHLRISGIKSSDGWCCVVAHG